MKKSILILVVLSLFMAACQKENDTKKVTYFVTGFADQYKVVYSYGENSKTHTETVDPSGSPAFTWDFSFDALPGEITYIYIESKEDISNSSNFNASILIDGKTFQKALSYDKTRIVNSDTVNFIKRSGTIPF